MKGLLKITTIALSIFLTSCELDELSDSNSDVRDEFTGNWLVNENSTLLGFRSYEVNIYKDAANDAQINILNFYKMGETDSIAAIVSTTEVNTLSIPSQNVNGNYIEGNGAIDGNEIDLVYYIDDGNDVDTVTSNYTRDIN